MADFSTILQSPEVRQVVQENLLERAFHDALFPGLLYRGEAVPQPWPAHSGDSQIFSAPGLIRPKQKPLQPGTDPTPSSYTVEQWESTLQQYADTIDTHMPTSIAAIIDLFMRNAHQLGMSASQSLNRIVRDRMYNAAMSGWTVATTSTTASASLAVQNLNGFTKARRPTVAGASKVRFEAVSAGNPLPITVEEAGGGVTRNVIGFTPTNPGDEIGPGVLLLDAVATVVSRGYVKSYDRSNMVIAGGGNSVGDISPADTLKLAHFRQAVSSFWQNSVPVHTDGRFHGHIDPVSISQVYEDPEFQRLNTSLPDYVIYRQFALGEMLNIVFFRNTESPIRETVQTLNDVGVTYSTEDQFGGELYSNGNATTGTPIHRVLLSAQGGIYEYFQDLMQLITDAGVTGKVAEPRIVNNGIEVMSDRIQLIIRGPLNRLQDLVSVSWKFIGDWPARTDATTGDTARYKRFITIEHGG